LSAGTARHRVRMLSAAGQSSSLAYKWMKGLHQEAMTITVGGIMPKAQPQIKASIKQPSLCGPTPAIKCSPNRDRARRLSLTMPRRRDELFNGKPLLHRIFNLAPKRSSNETADLDARFNAEAADRLDRAGEQIAIFRALLTFLPRGCRSMTPLVVGTFCTVCEWC
jgi:hypothetical protein